MTYVDYYNLCSDIKNYYSDGEFLFHEASNHTRGVNFEQASLQLARE